MFIGSVQSSLGIVIMLFLVPRRVQHSHLIFFYSAVLGTYKAQTERGVETSWAPPFWGSLVLWFMEIFCILDHNGAGKTITINILTVLFPPIDLAMRWLMVAASPKWASPHSMMFCGTSWQRGNTLKLSPIWRFVAYQWIAGVSSGEGPSIPCVLLKPSPVGLTVSNRPKDVGYRIMWWLDQDVRIRHKSCSHSFACII